MAARATASGTISFGLVSIPVKLYTATQSKAARFNMLLSDARFLYCYCGTKLTWLTRRAPFGEASLIDTELTVDFAKETTPRDIVTVIATHPLTDHEPWEVMEPGSMVVFKDGLPVAEWRR